MYKCVRAMYSISITFSCFVELAIDFFFTDDGEYGRETSGTANIRDAEIPAIGDCTRGDAGSPR